MKSASDKFFYLRRNLVLGTRIGGFILGLTVRIRLDYYSWLTKYITVELCYLPAYLLHTLHEQY